MNATSRTRRLSVALAVVTLAALGGDVGLSARTDVVTGAAGRPSLSRPAVDTGGHGTKNGIVTPSTTAVSTTPSSAPPESARAKRRSDGGLRPGEKVPSPGHHDEDEDTPDVNNGEGQNATSTKLLGYHNGPTQTSPRIYLVFWGGSWTSTGDPNGVASRLHYFYQGLGGSSWGSVLKQYGSTAGTFTNPTGQYRGWLRDTTYVPAQPTQAQVAAAAQRAALRVNDLAYNAQYVIATPYGVVDQYSTAKSFCAWHNYTYVSGSNWVTYTSLPYTPYLDDLGRRCGGGKVNGSNGRLDGVTILASHEYAETVNDPGLNAWYDADRDENADKCSWINLRNYTLTNGYAFPVQPYWSNSWRQTYGYGCYYS